MQLQIQKRDTTKKASSVRKDGYLPAVLYGRKEKSTAITIAYKEFEKVLHDAGESSVITLTGLEAPKEALIHAVDVDAVSNRPIHVDFYVIEKGQKVTVSIPLQFDGISPAVKDKGGILIKVMHELEVEALPQKLPHAIIVDISSLKDTGDQIHIKDLSFDKDVTPLAEMDDVVAMISEAAEEEVVEAPMDISQIEVQERGKKETEEVPEE